MQFYGSLLWRPSTKDFYCVKRGWEYWKTPQNDIVLVLYRMPSSHKISRFVWCITLSKASHLPRMPIVTSQSWEYWKTLQNDILLVLYIYIYIGLLRFWCLFFSDKTPNIWLHKLGCTHYPRVHKRFLCPGTAPIWAMLNLYMYILRMHALHSLSLW